LVPSRLLVPSDRSDLLRQWLPSHRLLPLVRCRRLHQSHLLVQSIPLDLLIL